jgi:hypothetical protein
VAPLRLVGQAQPRLVEAAPRRAAGPLEPPHRRRGIVAPAPHQRHPAAQQAGLHDAPRAALLQQPGGLRSSHRPALTPIEQPGLHVAGDHVAGLAALAEERPRPREIHDPLGRLELPRVGEAHLAPAGQVARRSPAAVEPRQRAVDAPRRGRHVVLLRQAEHPAAELGVTVGAPGLRRRHRPLRIVGRGALREAVGEDLLGALHHLAHRARPGQRARRRHAGGGGQHLAQHPAPPGVAPLARDGEPRLHPTALRPLRVGPPLGQVQAEVIPARAALGELELGPGLGRSWAGRRRRRAGASHQGAEAHHRERHADHAPHVAEHSRPREAARCAPRHGLPRVPARRQAPQRRGTTRAPVGSRPCASRSSERRSRIPRRRARSRCTSVGSRAATYLARRMSITS